MRKASPIDVQKLVALMTELYAEGGYPLNHQRATETFAALPADDGLGHVWIIRAGSQQRLAAHAVERNQQFAFEQTLRAIEGRPLRRRWKDFS